MTFLNIEHLDILKTIAENTTDIILFVENDGSVLFVTPSLKKTMGYEISSLLGKSAFNYLHEDDQMLVVSLHEEVVSTKTSKLCDYRVYHRDGNVVYLEAKVMPVLGEDQEIMFCVAVLRDITERKSAELALRKSEERYRLLQSSLNHFSSDLSKIMKSADLETRLLYEVERVINARSAFIFGMLRKQNIVVYQTGDDDLRNSHPLSSLPNDLSLGTVLKINNNYYVKIGESLEVSYFLSFILTSERMSEDDRQWLETIIHYVSILYDNLQHIEQLVDKLHKISESKETPVWVLRLLFNLSEKERMNLSSDLHDFVLQSLIDWYRKLENVSALYSHSELRDKLTGISEGILDNIYQIRSICNELRPPFFQEMGIIEVLKNLFDHTTQFHGNFEITYQFDDLDYGLNEEQILGIYRIVQELLNNAMKHSEATLVEFRISREKDNDFSLEYRDNGRGFEVDKQPFSLSHLGISGIKKRAQSLEGTIHFSSVINCGLTVQLKIPIQIQENGVMSID